MEVTHKRLKGNTRIVIQDFGKLSNKHYWLYCKNVDNNEDINLRLYFHEYNIEDILQKSMENKTIIRLDDIITW